MSRILASPLASFVACLIAGLLRSACSTALVAHWFPGLDSPLPRLATQAGGIGLERGKQSRKEERCHDAVLCLESTVTLG